MPATAAADETQLPDIRSVAPDLTVPPLLEGRDPAPGCRVRVTTAEGSRLSHVLYLPEDWRPGARYPVLVELAGNGPYEDDRGDVSTGLVEGSNMGYGLSAGRGCLWLCLPYLNAAGDANVRQWWGDPPDHDPRPTLEYAKRTVAQVCRDFGGDTERVVLMGFSRGAIACGFLGLHDDEVAQLWCGMLAFSHYDGVRDWPYPGSGRGQAAARLRRLGGRPQLIVSESTTQLNATREFLDAELDGGLPGQLTYLHCGYPNHNDTWTLRPGEARDRARRWLQVVAQLDLSKL